MIRNEYGRMEMNPLPKVTQAKVVLIGEYPNITELRQGQYFISSGADSLRATLSKFSIAQEDCYYTVAVPYLMSKKNKTLPVERWARERARLIDEIKQSRAEVVMPLGTLATSVLIDEKSVKITKVLGNLLTIPELPNVKILPNYHPALLLHSPGNYKVFSSVIETMSKLLRGEDVDPGITEWKWIEGEPELLKLRDRIEKLDVVGADIETSSLATWKAEIWTFGIAVDKNKVYVVSHEMIEQYPELIRELFNRGTKWIWHNGKFDTSVWWWKGFTEAWLDEDTILLHYCLNETNGTHGLGVLSTIYLGADEYKSKMNSEFAAITDMKAYLAKKQDLGERVATDADYTLQLYQILHKKVCEQSDLQDLYYKILIPASNFLRKVQMRGVKVDVPYLESRVPYYEEQLAEKTTDIQEAAAPFWDQEEYRAQTGAKSSEELFKPTSVKQLSWLIYDKLGLKPTAKQKKGKKGTGEEILESIPNPPTFILEILKLRKIKKEYSTYVTTYLEERDPKDIIHCTFNLHITATGRLSCTEPNIQNVPSGKPDIRRSLIPRDKNRIFMEVDYSGAELRVLAYISKDKNLTRALTEGDPHGELAEEIFGDTYRNADAHDKKMMRGRAKTVNFGVAYGRQAPNIAETFGISLSEAQTYIDTWANFYPEAWAYLQSCEVDVRAGRELVTLYGRHRRFGLIHQANVQDLINEGKNFRIQSISSDNTLLAAMKMDRDLEYKYNAYIVNLIHDSILIDCPADLTTLNAVAELAVRTMIHLPKQMYNCDVPFKSDVDLGPNWGDFAAYDIDTQTVNYEGVDYDYEEWITSRGVIIPGKEA